MRAKRALLLTVSCALVFFCTRAQSVIGRQNVDIFPQDPWHNTYALTWLPTDYATNTSEKYPLIIFLHGKGETGDGVYGLNNLLVHGLPARIASGWNPEAVNPADGKNYKFIVVSPQAPTAAYWSVEWNTLKLILPQILQKYRVDLNRVYVTGLSAGGQGTWSCVTSGPQAAQQFAAIVPVSSANAVPPDSIPLVGSKYGVKLWQICGDQDAFWPFVTSSTNLYNSTNPSPKAIATPFVGVGHWGWNTAYDPAWRSNPHNLNMYEWMLQYKRSIVAATLSASAGSNQSITLPQNSVNLTGSASPGAGGTITGYAWSKISGPAGSSFTAATSAGTQVNGLVEGNYVFRLTVTDNLGASATSDVQVTVNPAPNQAPKANAGADLIIQLPQSSVLLNGSATDADGSISSYAWSKLSGAAATIETAFQSQTIVSGLQEGIYKFILTVTDNRGAIARDTMQLTVNPAPNQLPTAKAGADISITLPTNSVSLNGSGTDPDGSITSYAWTRVSGPASYAIATPAAATTVVNNLVEGIYSFVLTVTDNRGGQAKDTVWVTVNPAPAPPPPPPPPVNVLPVANAGSDVQVTLPMDSALLIGSGSDSDGTVAGFQWRAISGPSTATIRTPLASQTVIANLLAGSYRFELTVTDNQGAIGKDTVLVTVLPAPPPPAVNQIPVVMAGNDQQITLPMDSILLQGMASDADGSVVSIQWTKISGPASYELSSSTTFNARLNKLLEGTYLMELLVTDDKGASARDTVAIIVNAAVPQPNKAPVANAGADITITLPVNNTTLSGSGSDEDGSIVSYQWKQVSGLPAPVATPAAASTALNGLQAGQYLYELTVTDNRGATARDSVNVTVLPAPNKAPVANAGADVTITLPVDSIMLKGSGTDADGNITRYQWTKVAGPASYRIAGDMMAQTLVSALVQGTYQFALEVTDNGGLTARDTVTVVVNAAALPNQPPTVDAGADQIIQLPKNSVTLSGNANDADGTIVSYMWSKISGPNTFTVSAPTAAQTQVVSMIAGTYRFELAVIDNKGARSKDTVTITVLPVPNVDPIANAGKDISITLPANTVQLTGSGSDSDGTVTQYLWTRISGPAQFSIANPSQAQTSVSNLQAGTYLFELKVTDNSGGTARDTVAVFVYPVPNKPPTANAGNDLVITLPTNAVALLGSGKDVDGTISSYKWARVSGPSSYAFTNANLPQTIVGSLQAGVYQFELTVTDNSGAIGRDTVQVTVNIPANVPPVANAGSDQSITLPVNSATVNGSASDTDGHVVAYQWSWISGPAQYVISSPNTGITSFNELIQGVYEFELKATDDRGGVDRDTVRVTVLPDPRTSSSASLYPNPATATLNIKIDALTFQNQTTVRIYDLRGLLVYREEFMRMQKVLVKQVDVSNLAPGAYVVIVNADINSDVSMKFVKQ